MNDDDIRLPLFSTVFQPIIHVGDALDIWAHEALIRGPRGESAAWVFQQVPDSRLYELDAASRRQALDIACGAGIEHRISLNAMPGAINHPHFGLLNTVEYARSIGFPPEQIIIELTEAEQIRFSLRTTNTLETIRRLGIAIGMDDFGTGFNNLTNFIHIRPDFLKIDMDIVNHALSDDSLRSFLSHIVAGCIDMGITPIAEGVETEDGLDAMRSIGINDMQGNYFHHPARDFPTADMIRACMEACA